MSPPFCCVWLDRNDKRSAVRRWRNPLGEREAQLEVWRMVTGEDAATSGAHGCFAKVCRVSQKKHYVGNEKAGPGQKAEGVVRDLFQPIDASGR